VDSGGDVERLVDVSCGGFDSRVVPGMATRLGAVFVDIERAENSVRKPASCNFDAAVAVVVVVSVDRTCES
jgi:hypothetical protein